MRSFSAICIAMLLGLGLGAAEQPGDFAAAQAMLKKAAPEEYAKIEKLAATDLSAALREFRAAAQKHDIRIPRPAPAGRFRRHAGDGERRERPERGERPRFGGRQRRGGNPLEQLVIDGKLRAAFPEEFDAAVKELAAAEDKLDKLAGRANLKYPPNFSGQLRKLRLAAPDKMAEIERRAADDPRAAMRELSELANEHGIEFFASPRRGGRNRDRSGGDAPDERPEPRRINNPPIGRLRRAFPEEMRQYDKLRQEDPEAAKKLLRELSEKLKQKR